MHHHPPLDHPPPTDGPNTRLRIGQGLAPVSGSVEPLYNSPPPPPSSGEHEQRWMSPDEWSDWLFHSDPSTGAGEHHVMAYPSELYPQVHVPDYSFDPITSSTTMYYIDPTLAFPDPLLSASTSSSHSASTYYDPLAPSTSYYTYEAYAPPSAPLPPPSPPRPPQPACSEPKERIFSSSSIVDHGSDDEPDDELFGDSAPSSNSKLADEAWLSLGDFQPDVFVPTVPELSPAFFPSSGNQLPPAPSPARQTRPQRPRIPGGKGLAEVDVPSQHASFSATAVAVPGVVEYPFTPTAIPHSSSGLSARTRNRTSGGGGAGSPSPSPKKNVRASPYPTSRASAPASSSPATEGSSAYSTFASTPLPHLPPELFSPSSPMLPSLPSSSPRKPHTRKRSLHHIPRPRNSFILFRSHAVTTSLIPKEMGIIDHKNISKVLGEVWRNLGDAERSVWERLAEREKMMHAEKFPGYRYQPKTKDQARKRASPGTKKKNRKGESDDDQESGEDTGRTMLEDYDWGASHEELPAKRKTRSSSPATAAASKKPTRRTRAESSVLPPATRAVRSDSPPSVLRQLPGEESKVEWTQDRVEATALALMEGVEGDQLTKRIEEQLASSTSSTVAEPQLGSSTSSTLPRPPPPWTSSTPFKHSRLARRSSSTNGSPTHPIPSPSVLDSSNGSSPLRESHRVSVISGDSPYTGRMAKDQSYALAQLSVSHSLSTSQPPTLPAPYHFESPTKLPHVHHDLFTPAPNTTGFDNSPLLASFQERKLSLGRWELRKPSCRREIIARDEEERLKNGPVEEEGFKLGLEEALEFGASDGVNWHLGHESLFDTEQNGLGVGWGSTGSHRED